MSQKVFISIHRLVGSPSTLTDSRSLSQFLPYFSYCKGRVHEERPYGQSYRWERPERIIRISTHMPLMRIQLHGLTSLQEGWEMSSLTCRLWGQLSLLNMSGEEWRLGNQQQSVIPFVSHPIKSMVATIVSDYSIVIYAFNTDFGDHGCLPE